MSSNNSKDEMAGLAVIVGFIGAVAFLVALFVFALACFITFIMTILCIVAWNEPLTIGKLHIEPDEARAFIGRGVAGAFLLPAFAVFCEVTFKIGLVPEVWPYLFIGGYVGGSLGIEFLMAQAEEQAKTGEILPPSAQIMAPPSPPQPQPQRPPFRFASWEDEEPGR